MVKLRNVYFINTEKRNYGPTFSVHKKIPNIMAVKNVCMYVETRNLRVEHNI